MARTVTVSLHSSELLGGVQWPGDTPIRMPTGGQHADMPTEIRPRLRGRPRVDAVVR